MRYILGKRVVWIWIGIAGILLLYLGAPFLLGIAHARNYSVGLSFWYAGHYYKSAFLLGWRTRSMGGPTPVFQHYYNQPRYRGADIPAAYSLIVFDPLPGQAEFTLHTGQLEYGGFGLYTKASGVDIPASAWAKLEISTKEECVYQEDLTPFDERSRERLQVPGLSGRLWDAHAGLLQWTKDGKWQPLPLWNNSDAEARMIWNLAFAATDSPMNSRWQFERGRTYRIRIVLSPDMPELVWMVRLRVAGVFDPDDFISLNSGD